MLAALDAAFGKSEGPDMSANPMPGSEEEEELGLSSRYLLRCSIMWRMEHHNKQTYLSSLY